MDSLRKSTPRTEALLPAPSPPSPSPSLSQPKPSAFPPTRPASRVPLAVILSFVALLAFVLLGLAGFFGWKIFAVASRMNFEKASPESVFSQIKNVTGALVTARRTPLRGEAEGRINILLLGRAGERYPGHNLTDTIMLLSIDVAKKKVALLSLPRDLYVNIPETSLYTKINSLYQYGLDRNQGIAPLEQAVEDITGVPVHYYFVLDFDGFEKAVDTLGGIQVDVPKNFYDTRYPGKNYSYETFELRQGWQSLDGPTALKYVRERHDDPEGDFGRAKRQQQTIQAMKDKAFSVGTLANPFAVNSLLDTLGESVKTDAAPDDIASFLELSKTLDTKNMATVVIDAWKPDSLLRVSHVLVGSVQAFILVPRLGNWSEIRDRSENIFALENLDRRRQNIASEGASLTILASAEDAGLSQKVAGYVERDLGIASVSVRILPASEKLPSQSLIVDNTSLGKPWSLDELLKKLSLQKAASLPVPEEASSDFTLLLGNEARSSFSLDGNAANEQTLEESSFGEILPPSPKQP